MKSILTLTLSLGFALFFVACQSTPVLMTAEDIELTRTAPTDADCRELDVIEVRTQFTSDGENELIAKLKERASSAGANIVLIEEMSPNKTAVRGRGYFCP